MRKIIVYVILMCFLGASIGAIVALSKTSVSNTLLQVIVTFIGGSAGLYFLNRKTIKDDSDLTSLVGYIGILFLLSFWGAFIIFDIASEPKKIYYDWNDEQTIETNLIQAEVEKHLDQLGIDPKHASDILQANTPPLLNQTAFAQCLQGDISTKQFTLDISSLYSKIQSCATLSYLVTNVAGYLHGLAQQIQNDDTRIPQMTRVLNAIFQATPDAILPNIQGCYLDEKRLKTMNLLKERLALCQQNSKNYMLHLIREHASSYYKVWQKNPQIKKESPLPILESLSNSK